MLRRFIKKKVVKGMSKAIPMTQGILMKFVVYSLTIASKEQSSSKVFNDSHKEIFTFKLRFEIPNGISWLEPVVFSDSHFAPRSLMNSSTFPCFASCLWKFAPFSAEIWLFAAVSVVKSFIRASAGRTSK